MAEKRKARDISAICDEITAKKLKSSVSPRTTKEKMAANVINKDALPPIAQPPSAYVGTSADQGENCLRTLMLTMSKDLHTSIASLGERINTLEDNIENRLVTRLTSAIHTTIKEEISRVRSDFDSEICAMKTKILDMEKTFSDVVKSGKSAFEPTPSSTELSVVIKNLNTGHNETVGQTNIVKNKVISLVRDGLKLKDVKVTNAERKQSRGDNPGIVVASFETIQQTTDVLKKKSMLRKTNDYRSVYIEPLLSQSALSTQSTLRTLLKEMGKEKQYIVNGQRLIRRNTNNSVADDNPVASQSGSDRSRDKNDRARHSDNRSRQANGRGGHR